MTLRELSQLYWLKKEIAMDEERLQRLSEKAASPTSPNYSGMNVSGGPQNIRLEEYVCEIIDLRAIIMKKREQCIYEQSRLERYIANIDDSLTRQIFTLRFVECLSWGNIVMQLGGGNIDSVRQTVYRYLKKH